MKHNIKKRIAAILCAFTLSFPVANWSTFADGQNIASASVFTNYLSPYLVNQYCSPIPQIMQNGQNDCWAAVLRTLTVYKQGFYPSDYELFNLVNNYRSMNGLQPYPAPQQNTSPLYMMISSGEYEYVTHNYFSTACLVSHTYQTLNENLVAWSINNDKPIIMLCQSSNSAGHILLLTGYFADNTNGDNMSSIMAYDPYTGNTMSIATSSNYSTSFYGPNGLLYTWNKSIII